MMQAIQAVYPNSRLQRCIVHQIRSPTRYVNWKDIKQVTADLKMICTAVTLDEAEDAFPRIRTYLDFFVTLPSHPGRVMFRLSAMLSTACPAFVLFCQSAVLPYGYHFSFFLCTKNSLK